MNKKRILTIFSVMMIAAILVVGTVLAGSNEDGQMMRRNISKTPDSESGEAGMAMMSFYVPAQSSNGELLDFIEYFDADAVSVDQRAYAKPLLAFYNNDIHEEEHQEELAGVTSGIGFGAHDAFVGLSLDDGVSWKRMNVSNAAHLSSFVLANGEDYPGDTYAGGIAVAGDRVFAAWLSRYCLGGTAAYTLADINDFDADGDTEELLPDYFGVAGSQGSVDYSLQGHPDVGEIPFGCVWSARGQLVSDGQGGHEVTWTKPERLTSGRRDPNRLEIAGVSDAGFAIVWQEDPEGLKPGTGLGPGEGWSGAIANAKTDIWYSYVSWEDFDLVCPEGSDNPCLLEDAIPLAQYMVDFPDGTAPKVATSMAVPVRVTDNGKCQLGGSANEPYCYMDFSGYPLDMDPIPDTSPTTLPSDATFCIDTVEWQPINATSSQDVCVTTDKQVLMGRVAATRPRIGMHGYDTDGDGFNDGAWVLLGYEETKALGEGTTGVEGEIIDEGKNLWYHSFDMEHPDIVSHGNILNQPAKDPATYQADETAEFFPVLLTDEEGLDLGAYNYQFYETEIARRFSLISQDWDTAGDSGAVAFTLIKQGIIKQGGPADIFARTFLLPEGFDPEAEDFDPIVDNPYAFENMRCDEWAFRGENGEILTPGDAEYNPYYPKGVCLDDPVNLSGTKAIECESGDCPPILGTGGVYTCDAEGVCEWDTGAFERVTKWAMCGPDFDGMFTPNEVYGFSCEDTVNTMDDQSWYNPYDIAKGHRGYMDGDFIMVLYAWSPNYKLNAVGHDHYNLYIRRSFDGGVTWTTTPADTDWPCIDEIGNVASCDGTEFFENFGYQTSTIVPHEYILEDGQYEPARNVSQLIGSQETILDPRYSPTLGDVTQCMMDTDADGIEELSVCPDNVLYDDPYGQNDDLRDRSIFFVVYETGDNTTVTLGEATPLDLFYSRATNWGDDYDLFEYTNQDNEIVEAFDWLEKGDPESGEASITTNSAGTFFYAVWNQALEIGEEEFTDMDVYFRRVMYLNEAEDETQSAITSILYVSNMMPFVDEPILVIGSARDGDHVGLPPLEDIGDMEWTDTYMGITQVLEDDDGDPKRLNIPAHNLQPGWHGIEFKASDKGGNWSNGARVDILVTDGTNVVFLPLSVAKP
jgi:hypothetical protein